nr:MAG TPA: hypothetical protein [Caudoviricetes sp.]
MHKNVIKQKKCYKNMQKNSKARTKQRRSKNHGNISRRTQRGPQHHKGSLKRGTHITKQGGDQTKRDAHHTIHVMGATPPPPSGREHPEGLPISPCLWKTLWITPVTQTTM